jgi:hypothetical protein
MQNKTEKQNRPIDRLRECGGSFDIKTPDDDSAISGMLTLGKRLLIIKEQGIYEFKSADQIDPERTNINTPNTIQQLLPYGSNQQWVGAVVLTGKDLLRKEVLETKIDTDNAMTLVLEIAQNIASAIELKNDVFSSQDIEIKKYDLKIRPDRSFILPLVQGIKAKCNEFSQKSGQSLAILGDVDENKHFTFYFG